MIHLAYPNVENGRLSACVRYLSLPGEQEPGPLYYPATPNAGNLMAVRQATRDLIPEWGQRGYEARVYEKRDLPGTLRGDSLELTYFLALVRCVYPLVLEAVAEVGDVWGTGVMEYLNGKPVLKYVQEPGFTAKLAGFLAQAPDRIFLVPAANVYHEQEHICREHDVHVLTLPAFREAVQVARATGRWPDKVVVTLEGFELLELVDTLFKRPRSFASAEPNYDLPGVWVEQAAHLHTFAGRAAWLERLEAWVDEAGDEEVEGRYFLLLGPPGQGKSALLAQFAQAMSDTSAPAAGADRAGRSRLPRQRVGCLLHMVKQHKNPERFLQFLLWQAQRLLGESLGPAAYASGLPQLN